MDAPFMSNEEARTNFLHLLMQSYGCTYICLWSPHPSNFLFFLDGFYQEESNQPTSSSGSIARRLFDAYKQSIFPLDNNRIPGIAFRMNVPYIELRDSELRALASIETQRQFYQKAVFMGCSSGEIELGFANETQVRYGSELNPPTSSSSSLISLSMDSPDSSLMFNIQSTTHMPQALQDVPSLPPIKSTTTTNPHQQAMQAFSSLRNIQLPTPESEDAEMTRAILAVLTSPSSSTSSSHQAQQNLPPNYQPVNPRDSAFKNYNSALAPTTTQTRASLRRHNLLKRAISYYRSLDIVSRQNVLGSRPITTTQLHHMISERKRREKLNESFQALRSLLPPGTKKDKASVLASTREFLSTLKAQIEELSKRNQLLEAQVLPAAREALSHGEEASGSLNERLNVRITHVPESTPEERIIDLHVTVRGECHMADMVIRILEFLKQDNNVNLMSIEANTRMTQSTSVNVVILRLRVVVCKHV
ncbi:HLH domain-containing protein [Cephalotus follicularis]|uniref:HLH domain-containing protein n=1 Tax=Cephalotus follicularis TaxID=3775 RepID=A0A1Q3CE59_CEPFO|nr:HLH domain-containing protein [Cephalotus follicularis]